MPSDDVPESPMVDPEDRLPTSAPRGGRGRTRGGRSLLTRLLPVLIVVVALGGFVGLVGYYYMAAGPNGVPPLIKADQQPFKVKPENPGGMNVPDQDKEIYDRMGRVDQSSVPPPNTERLLPPPETPLPRPVASVPPPAPPAAASPAVPGAPAANPPAVNPNVGGPVLGVPAQPRAKTLSTAPPGGTAAEPPQPPPRAVATLETKPPAAPTRQAPAPATKAAAVAPPHATAPQKSGGPILRVASASVRTEAEAKREWERQRRLYPEALSAITPSYASIDLREKGVYWRIYVGPAEPGSEARARCEALKKKKVDCFVARP